MQMIADGKDIDASKLDFKFFVIKNDKKSKEYQYTLTFGDMRFHVPYENCMSESPDAGDIAKRILKSFSWTTYVDALKAAGNKAIEQYASKRGECLCKAASTLELLQVAIDNATKTKIDVSQLDVIDINDKHAIEQVCAA